MPYKNESERLSAALGEWDEIIKNLDDKIGR